VLIDWFTVGAQLLNFLILVWLMKRFLYQPVLDAIAAREQKIAAELAGAVTAQAEAQQQQDEFRKKNEAFDEQRAELLRRARDAAKAEAGQLQSEAREAADAARAALAKALLSDARRLRADITRHAQDQVFDISRQVLGDLASVRLEQQACEVFIQRLRAVGGAARATLGEALKAATDAKPAMLRSAFELPAVQQAAIRASLDESFGKPIALKFETAPELVSGIELSAQGQKLAWSISDYLVALSSGLQERLGAKEPA
jgi:F-type H+-transporting ATPase subunit b